MEFDFQSSVRLRTEHVIPLPNVRIRVRMKRIRTKLLQPEREYECERLSRTRIRTRIRRPRNVPPDLFCLLIFVTLNEAARIGLVVRTSASALGKSGSIFGCVKPKT